MIYGSFASMVLRHPSWWFPWACLVIIWSLSHFDIFRVEIIKALNNLHASHVKQIQGRACSTPPGWQRTPPCPGTKNGLSILQCQVRATCLWYDFGTIQIFSFLI